MMRIITREEWGARYGDGSGQAQLPASEVWLHHSVTIAPDMVLPRDDDYAAIRLLDQIGKNRFGWHYGFPYTFAVTPAGLIFEGHDVAQMGAHTYRHNWTGRGICLVGNYETHHPPEPMLRAVAWLLQHGHTQGWWTQPELTGGHRDVYATACPGIHAYNAIEEINQLAASGPIEEDDMTPEQERKLDELHRLATGYFVESVKDPRPGHEGETLYASTALDWLFGWLYGYHVESVNNPYGGKNQTVWAGTALNWLTQWLYQMQAKQDAMAAAVAALSDDSTLTADRVEQLVRDAVQQNIEITGTVTVTGQEGQAE